MKDKELRIALNKLGLADSDGYVYDSTAKRLKGCLASMYSYERISEEHKELTSDMKMLMDYLELEEQQGSKKLVKKSKKR